MQELLDEFDPLSLRSPSAVPSTSLTTRHSPSRPSLPTSNSRPSQLSAPLFQQPVRVPPNRPPPPPTQTFSATKVQQATHDPLNALGSSSVPTPDNTSRKTDEALRAAQQRSQSRQQALAQHLAREPFRPSSPVEFPHLPSPPAPIITLADLGALPTSTKVVSSPTSGPTIKIPTELFQHHQTRSSPPISKKPNSLPSSPKASSPLSKIEQEKLAAALNEDFDEFVSSSNSTHPPQIILPSLNNVLVEREFEVLKPGSGRSTPSCFDGPEGRPTPIKLLGLGEQSQAVMDDELAEGIRLHLPPRLKIPARWELLYSIDQHGTSLGTLYQRVGAGPKAGGCVVLVIRDGRGDRFGAFVNEPLRPSKEYYGTGECFLWKAVNFEPDDFRIGVSVRTYAWTGANDYMILSDQEMLSVGGGDGKFGLWIDSNLEKGISATCPAFGNEVLCSLDDRSSNGREEGSFEVLGLECWRIVV